MSKESRQKAFAARQRRQQENEKSSVARLENQRTADLSWHARWRTVIRAGETSVAVAFLVGAISVGSDALYFVLLLLVAAVVSWIAILTEPSLSKTRKCVWSLVVTLMFCVFTGANFYHQRAMKTENVLAQQSLPGFLATFNMSILNVAEARRQYIFSYSTPEGAKAELYFSANDIFIFSITDAAGEVHSVEMPVGSSGIPFAQEIYLTCEAGVTSNSTHMRVLVDDKQVQQMALNYKVDLGSRRWTSGKIGADFNGRNNGAFQISTIGIGHLTATDEQVRSLVKNEREYLGAVRPKENGG